jgi:prophage regulatory protein
MIRLLPTEFRLCKYLFEPNADLDREKMAAEQVDHAHVSLRPAALLPGPSVTHEGGVMSAAVRFLRMPAVSAAVGFKPAWIYKLIREGAFPAPVRIGKRAVAWKSSDVDAWITSRPSTRAE